MTAPVFVDTNVFLYAFDAAAGSKQQAAILWLAHLWQSGRGRVSYQVLQEYYANVSQKWPAARTPVREKIRELLAWQPVAIDGAVIELAWKTQDRFRLSFWDSLIVAAAKAASCRYLLTEDFQPGQDLEGVLVVHPFHGRPGVLPRE
ncbi:MAG TPA: PIN domain-containing protein [Candidatus Acidoferrales bacterium]|nr:PIN domain-containing protein [Candidatus Acidoferrales bacterium]